MRGSALRVAEVVVEVTVAVTVKAVLDVVVINATSATNLDTLHVNAKKIKIFATAAMALVTLRKIASRRNIFNRALR